MGQVTIVPVSPVHGTQSGQSVWSLPAEVESEIVTLAAVCHDKQQQREPLTNVTGAQTENWTDDDEIVDDSEEGSSTRAATLTTDTTTWIKTNLLDRLAEIFCNYKEASYVTCTSMIAHADSATVLVARNAKWIDADSQLIRKIAIIMEQIASQEPLQSDVVLELCTQLANHYVARLHHHVQSFLRLLEKHKLVTDVTNTLRQFQAGKTSAIAVVECADVVAGNPSFTGQIRSLCNASAAKQILDELQCIRRPRLACNAICRAAQDVDSFQKVKILLLSGYPPKKVEPTETLIPRPPKRTVMEYLAKVKWVHVEIRMVTYLLSHDSYKSAFPYLGISKKTCLLCGHITQHLGRFNTRSNHGKIYSQWTVPSNIQLNETYIGPWGLAVEHVRDILRREAARHTMPYMQAVKESTITTPVAPRLGSANVFTAHVDDRRLREREATWLSSLSKRQVAGAKLKCDESVDGPRHALNVQRPETQSNDLLTIDQEHIERIACSYCHSPCDDPIKCSKCEFASYCDRDCRQKAWVDHKFHCHLGRPIDAADYLLRYCHREQYPSDDDEVGTAFGFRHFIGAADRQKLFGLYCKLVRFGGISDDELREALKSNRLKELILYRGQQLPAELIRNNLIWLCSQNGFAANSIANFGDILESARDVLGSRQFNELESVYERHAYLFYCQIRNGYIPDVDEDNWLQLGFCAARTSDQQSLIGRWYGKLIESCTFEEFWHAMETSTMAALFGKYGLASEVGNLYNFETLLQTVGRWHQSVWELKRFTLWNDPEPMRAVFVDYGFRNCESSYDRLSLRNMYCRYFEMGFDEMDLHKACIEGNMSSFLESTLGELPIRSELLSNP